MEDQTSQLIVPIIALSEACWMIEHGKTSIPTGDAFLQTVETDPRVTIMPLDRLVLQRTFPLKEITEMHDRHIVATALLLRDRGETVAILTKDANISGSGLVSTVW